jgi:hypothetical protein
MSGRWVATLRVVLVVVCILVSGISLADVFPDPTIPRNSRAGSDRSHGVKQALYLVVHDINDPFTPAEWNARVNSIRTKEIATRKFFAENSGGKFDIYYGDIIDAGIVLGPGGSRPDDFWTQANNIAISQGKSLSDYYMFAYDINDLPPNSGQGWGGLSTSNRIYLQSTSQNTINHEIGHQTGADHAKSFVTTNNSTYHPYTWDSASQQYVDYVPGVSPYNPLPYGVRSVEYGNPFDTMGNTSGGDFRVREKLEDLQWLTPAQVPRLDGPTGLGEGTYRIYAHDELQWVTNGSGNYGVAQTYNPDVYYGLTYQRVGEVFTLTGSSTGSFQPETQTVDIEYRSNSDGAYIYLNGTLVDVDSETANLERLLEVGRSIEDIDFGLSRFAVNTGQVNQEVENIDFLNFNPPPPTLLASSWFHITSLGTGRDSIGSYIDLAISTVSALNGLAGDLNQDNILDEIDLELLIAGWMTDTSQFSSLDKYLKGDMNFDGLTDLKDIGLFRNAWLAAGNGELHWGGIAVPEPATVLGLVLAGAGGVLVRRRRTSRSVQFRRAAA